ncbi:hypothetical protein VPH35_135330 [Triticum aestivum]
MACLLSSPTTFDDYLVRTNLRPHPSPGTQGLAPASPLPTSPPSLPSWSARAPPMDAALAGPVLTHINVGRGFQQELIHLGATQIARTDGFPHKR